MPLFVTYTDIAVLTGGGLLLLPFIWRKLTYKPLLLEPVPADYRCALPLTDESSSTYVLPDDRNLGYAQYGDLEGMPIVYLHGLLGSRFEGALLHPTAKELGIRIIAVERPGYGRSSPYKASTRKRNVLDHAKDVHHLVQHLKLGKYAILGISGGGPFALACAASHVSASGSAVLSAVSIVTGAGLPDMTQSWPAPLVFLNKHFNLAWLLNLIFKRSPEWQLHLFDEDRLQRMRQSLDLRAAHPADVAVARQPDYPDMQRLFLKSSRAATQQNWEGFYHDISILSREPGFKLNDIPSDLPVQLWYGTNDKNVSVQVGYEIAARLREGGNDNVTLHIEPGETHSSTQVKFKRQYLQDLVRVMQE